MIHLIARFKNKFDDKVFVLQYVQVLRYVVSFVISIILVQSALKPDDLGHYEVILFIVTSLTAFWSAGIKNAIFSWYQGLEQHEKRIFPFQTLVLMLLASFFIAIGCLICKPYLCRLFGPEAIELYWPYLCFLIFLTPSLILIESFLYLRDETSRLLLYGHWSHGGLLILTLLVAFYAPSLFHFVLLLVVWTGIKMVYLITLVLPLSGASMDWLKVKKFVIFSLPLIANLLIGSAMDMVDGLFVTHFFDTSFFPIFKYGARELPLSGILFGTLSVAMIPIIIQSGIATLEVKRRATALMHWIFPFSILLLLVSPLVFVQVYDETYRTSAYIFNIYLLILSSRVLLPQAFTMAMHHHSIIIWSGLVEILINIGLSFWWVQIWGVYGLAMATVVAYFFQKIMLIFYNYQKFGILPSHYINLRFYIMYMLIMTCTFFISIKMYA